MPKGTSRTSSCRIFFIRLNTHQKSQFLALHALTAHHTRPKTAFSIAEHQDKWAKKRRQERVQTATAGHEKRMFFCSLPILPLLLPR
jgi:hypothetical protein